MARVHPNASAGATPPKAGLVKQLRASLQRLRHTERLQRALFDIADMAGSASDMQSLLSGLHRSIAQLMYAENFFIALYNPQHDTLRFIYFVDEVDGELYHPDQEFTATELQNSIMVGMIRHGKPMRGSSLQITTALGLDRHHNVGSPSIDFMAVPMRRDGQVYGVLAVQSYQKGRGYSQSDQDVLAFVAEHVLNAVERKMGQEALERRVTERTRELAQVNARLQEQVQERERAAHLQSTLYRIAALSHEQISSKEFYHSLHQAVGELINVENFYIALKSADNRWLDFPYYVDELGGRIGQRPLGRGMSEYAMRCAQTVLLSDTEISQLIARGEVHAATYGEPAVCWLGAPLTGTQGVIGVVVVQSYRTNLHFTRQDADLLTFVSYQIAATLLRRQQDQALQALNIQLEQRVRERTIELQHQIAVREHVQQQLQHQVMHDPLTCLPNRVYVRDQLEIALARQKQQTDSQFALLYLDVDRFKLFNDGLGHQVGDRVLQEVAIRMADCVRSPDILGRLAGDEFSIILVDCRQPADACQVAQRIQARMQEAIEIAGRRLHVSLSIGIAMGQGYYCSVDELLHDADTALYQAKAAGRRCFVVFDANVHDTATNVLDVEQQLRVGLETGQFVPYFQPIVQLADARVVSFEALIRWFHPDKGVLGPDLFLPVAEKTGLIEALDWHIYDKVCQVVPSFLGADQVINLNLSPHHFHGQDFAGRFLELLSFHRIPFKQVCAEVTESSLLSDPVAAARILGTLNKAGIRVALDDFGTGFSSLSHVHQFPLNSLKIDRSFISQLGSGRPSRSAAIVSAVIGLARALHIHMVAEGVETVSQRDHLIAMGCERAQGLLYGSAQPAEHWQIQNRPGGLLPGGEGAEPHKPTGHP
jgi:diguanylate cyclase (GGDEF)-like protein